MSFVAVILAAGSGSRAGSSPKQWRILAGRPVLAWSVDAFARAGAERIVVAVPAVDLARAGAVLAPWPAVELIAGGETRVDSARAALARLAAAPPAAVLIHDAARPFVTPAHVSLLLAALADADGAVPALAVADTLKRPGGAGALETVDRTGLVRAQTPQAFRHGVLAAAFAALPPGQSPTDDAAVVSAAGGRVVTVPGDPMLMKLTYPEDFAMAEALAGARSETRVGTGYDVHAFGPGDAVWLCGIRIPHDRGLVGHSDADVGLHALTDAVLGAAAAGDIGDHFPPTDPRWKGAASDQFLRHAVDLAGARGGRLVNADVTLICEEPRIKAHREAMRARIAEITGLDIGAVSVKATTTEGLGFEGRREAIAAQAVASLHFRQG